MSTTAGIDLDHVSERQELHITLTLGTAESVATVIGLLTELLKEPASDLSLEVRELAKQISALSGSVDAMSGKVDALVAKNQ